jgi:uncharacterized membrane protein YozB (DUF420 family)
MAMLKAAAIFFVVFGLIQYLMNKGEEATIGVALGEAAFATVIFLILMYLMEHYMARRKDGGDASDKENE